MWQRPEGARECSPGRRPGKQRPEGFGAPKGRQNAPSVAPAGLRNRLPYRVQGLAALATFLRPLRGLTDNGPDFVATVSNYLHIAY